MTTLPCMEDQEYQLAWLSYDGPAPHRNTTLFMNEKKRLE